MSQIKLQSITTNQSAPELPDYYVGAIVESESGYLIPKLTTSVEQLESIYKDFPYINMYKDFIKRQIPVCLLPVITPESKYNVCSLRLSNGLVTVSYPKKDKTYRYRSLSSVIRYDFFKSDLDETNSIEITHTLTNSSKVPFNPRVVVEVNDSEVKTRLTYKDNKIKATFSEPVDGSISIESLPQVEMESENILINYFGSLGNNDTSTKQFQFKVNEPLIPEIVVTRSDTDIRYGEMVQCHVEIDTTPDENEQYTVTVKPIIPEFDCRYRVDARIIPQSLVASRAADGESHIAHNGGRYPLIKVDKNGVESWASVFFTSENYCVVTVKDIDNSYVRYNVVTTEKDFDFNLLSTGQTTFNLILDLSKVSYQDLIKEGNSEDPSNFIIVKTITEDCMICSGEWHRVTSTYFNTDAIYNITDPRYPYRLGYGETDEECKYYLIEELKEWYNKRYANTCSTLNDRVYEFVNTFIVNHGMPEMDQYGEQVFIDQWKEKFIEAAYIEDFWLADNQDVVDILNKVLKKYDGLPVSEDHPKNGILTQYDLELEIKNLHLDNSKLLLEYALPVQDLNHYRMDGISVDDHWNLSQDKLCEFTEQDKVVDFFSKIKGPAGRDIQLTINKVNFYEDLYDIEITNGIIYENYTVRLYDLNYECPMDTIFISDITKHSQLVEVYLYNYWYNTKLIDSLYYNELETDVPYNPSNLRDISELKLPVGNYTLDRVTKEKYTTKDRLNTINIYKESDWYPDLFLVDKLPDILDYPKEILDLVDWNEDKDKSIYSQALIKLEYSNLNKEWFPKNIKGVPALPSNNNRLLYFYDDIIINDERYPSYYPYVLNILNQQYIQLPTDKFIYNPFSLMEGNTLLIYSHGALIESAQILVLSDNFVKLKYKHVKYVKNIQLTYTEIDYDVSEDIAYALFNEDKTKLYFIESADSNIPLETDIEGKPIWYDCHGVEDLLINEQINFMNYDNLMYFYKTLREPLWQDSTFIIRFITSKYTREVMQELPDLKGSNPKLFLDACNRVNSRCMKLLPLVQYSTYNTDFDGNRVSVDYQIKIHHISNRLYKVNYFLNV